MTTTLLHCRFKGLCALFSLVAFPVIAADNPQDYFVIRVVDEETGRGVPLVELKATSEILYYTDSNGIIAFHEPGLMGQEVFFHVKSHGYEFAADFLGYRGKKLRVVAGGSQTLKIKRLNIAERLYRVTGQGIYRDSVLAAIRAPLKNPTLNGQVIGQDSVMATPYRGKVFWFWGDTQRPSYPLGHFGTAGATSELPGQGGLDPSLGVDLTYFVDATGFSQPMCDWNAPGMKWISGLMTLRDPQGRERLLSQYASHKNLDDTYERGLIVFNDDKSRFERLMILPPETPLMPNGVPFPISAGGVNYLYFDEPYPIPTVRVRANWQSVTNPAAYEGFTCLVEGSRYDGDKTQLDRSPDGTLRYAWKRSTQPLDARQEDELLKLKRLKSAERLLQQLDFETGKSITAGGSVAWNPFRHRWVLIGRGDFPDVWYAEADTPIGPWVYARKVVTHDRYTFYNVRHHVFFDQENGRRIYFEGTYTDSFSNPPFLTPRYNYNQIMYRLDLADPRLFLPVAVYRVKGEQQGSRYLLREQVDAQDAWQAVAGIPFFAFAPERRLPQLIPIYARKEGRETMLETNVPADGNSSPAFYALPIRTNTVADARTSVTGPWQCRVKESGEKDWEIQFALELTQEGPTLRGKAATEEIRNGQVKDGIVRFTVSSENEMFDLEGHLENGKLVGKVHEPAKHFDGVWEAERLVSGLATFTSPAVVPLYEYRSSADGKRLYSTEPSLADVNWQRSSQPICRVWRNPMSSLLLERDTRPSRTVD